MVDIVDLDPNVPTGQDLVSRGDDEIVRIKQALVEDFGGIDGPVFEDADEQGLNGTTKMTAQTLSSFNARIQANTDAIAASDAFVIGQIIMWYGALTGIPDRWALCDGSTVNDVVTPDLRDKFIRAAGGADQPGDTGGADSVTSSLAGAHTHPGSTAAGTALTPAQLPDLSNNIRVQMDASSQSDSHTETDRVARGRGGASTAETAPMTTTGLNGQAHTHALSVTSDGLHGHTVATVPAYYALAYIIYVGEP